MIPADERVEIARAYLAAARQHDAEHLPPTRLLGEDAELRRQLGLVLGVIDGQAAALTPEQAALVLSALRDAMDYRTARTIGCPECDAAEIAGESSAACERHRPDMEQAGRYDALGRLLAGEVTS